MMAMDNKAIFMGLCAGTMTDYMPDGGFFLNDVHEGKRADIEQGLSCDEYVIKMPEAAKGTGTMVVRREDMFDVLHAITNSEVRAKSPVPIDPYWDENYSPLILYQEKVQGKPVMHQGKPYDPTMRVVMTAHIDDYDKPEVKLKVHDAYWKFPRMPVNEGTLQERTVSYSPPGKAYAGDFNARVEASGFFSLVSDADKEIVWARLHECIPQTVSKLVNIDSGEMAHKWLDLENPNGVALSMGMMAASMGRYFDGYDKEMTALQPHFPPDQPVKFSEDFKFKMPEQLALTMLTLYHADPEAPWGRYLKSLHHPSRKHCISPQFYESVLQHIKPPSAQLSLPLEEPGL
jgi:hypothetical protein